MFLLVIRRKNTTFALNLALNASFLTLNAYMEQTERIKIMEQRMDRASQAVMTLSAALDQYEAAHDDIKALSDYYGSETWRQDFKDDEAGRLPADLKRGVLSEDGVWNLLADNRDLRDRLLKLCMTILLLFVTLAGQVQIQPPPALVGSWSGKLQVGGMSLTLVLHLEQADGFVKASLDSPDQGAKGMSAEKEYLSDDSLAVKLDYIGMTYRAKLKDGKLDGTFSQNGIMVPLVLTRGVLEMKRPQMPQSPYPYKTEEVTFNNEADGATLAGTLTWPVATKTSKGNKRPTVVLLVSGSGQQNRDEEVFNHKPFLVIADFLARQGIATLRYDDRATGKSVGGEVKNATTEDFMHDADAGLNYLRNRREFGKVGILGHSEGGAIAFMLGAKKQTDFIVSLAGPGVKGDTLLAAQGNRILAFSGMPATITVAKYRQQEAVQQVPWIQWFIDYDPSADISQTHCPVFALNGTLDCQVISSLNLKAIKRLLPKDDDSQNLVKEYPSLNHLFQHAVTGLPTEYSQIEETISTEVLQDVAQWINGLK